MARLTEACMQGKLRFAESFLNRVGLLNSVPVSTVHAIVREIPVNEALVKFIQENRERCFIVTGNLDIWVAPLVDRMIPASHLYSSRADIRDDHISKVVSIIDKESVARQFIDPIVAVGDGDNDVGMAKAARIGIGFGGVREVPPSLREAADCVFCEEKEMVEYLQTLL